MSLLKTEGVLCSFHLQSIKKAGKEKSLKDSKSNSIIARGLKKQINSTATKKNKCYMIICCFFFLCLFVLNALESI